MTLMMALGCPGGLASLSSLIVRGHPCPGAISSPHLSLGDSEGALFSSSLICPSILTPTPNVTLLPLPLYQPTNGMSVSGPSALTSFPPPVYTPGGPIEAPRPSALGSTNKGNSRSFGMRMFSSPGVPLRGRPPSPPVSLSTQGAGTLWSMGLPTAGH